MVARLRAGLTMKRAPASMQARAVSASRTVPAPRSTSDPNRRATCSMTPMAPGTVIVISRTGTPPSRIASTTLIASSADCARTTGTSPTSAILRSMSSLVMPFASARRRGGAAPRARRGLSPLRSASPGHPRPSALHDPQDLVQGRHRGVAGRGHGQRAVGGAALDRPLRALAGQQPIDEPGREGVAAADAVHDLEAGTRARSVELPFVVDDGAPVVHGRGARLAERGGDDPEVRELPHRALDHPAEVLGVEAGEVLVEPFHREAEGGREVLLVAEHDVHEGRELPVHLLRAL